MNLELWELALLGAVFLGPILIVGSFELIARQKLRRDRLIATRDKSRER
ncbi:MAG: hypothetical protein K2W81_05260 [Sphingomonas sp.]|nr:hypothetical protein [Sphingomonas sp.]MBY0283355.1 hypothetical protein [Sphingomonas sp.]